MATTKKFEVKSGLLGEDGKESIVDLIEVKIYDTIQEMIAELGEDKVFKLAQSQHTTNEKNKARAAAVKGPTKEELYGEAMKRIVTDEDLLNQYKGVITNPEATKAFVEGVADKIADEYNAKKRKRIEEAAKRAAASEEEVAA